MSALPSMIRAKPSETDPAAVTSTTTAPARARRSPELLAIGIFFVVLAAIPLVTRSEFVLFVATQLCVYFAVALGLNFLAGYGGQTSIGHGALVAVGAYVTAIGMVDHQWSFWAIFPVALVLTAVFGAVMAIPAFRVSAWYFALITLAFAQVVNGLLIEWEFLTKGFAGIVGIPMPAIGSYVFTPRDLYWLVLAFSIGAFFVTRNLVRGRYGRALLTMRDNPLAAVSSGVSLVWLKLFAFIYSALLAGAAGAFYAVQRTVVTPEDFSGELSIFFLIVIVIGGMGRLYGALFGTLLFFMLPELMSSLQSWRLLIYGVILLLLTLYVPEGLAGAISKRWARRFGNGEPTRAGTATAVPKVEGSSLSVRKVTKRFGGVAALQGVSLDVGAGTVHAIVGPNGSGKTTLLNMITRYYEISEGEIRIDDTPLGSKSSAALARGGVRRTFQTPKLVPSLSVLENVMLGAYASEKAGMLSVALSLPSAVREREERIAEAMNYLSFVGLDSRADVPAGEVPHGQQRLAEIARALVGRPRLLLLDEPAAGLSMSELDGLCALIQSIASIGTTVVIVEHHLDLVATLARDVTVLEQGKVLASGTPERVFKDPRVIAAYMGVRAVQTEDSGKEAAHA